MTSEMLYNYVTCFKNAFLISGDLRLSCVQISLISDTGPIFAIREPCPLVLIGQGVSQKKNYENGGRPLPAYPVSSPVSLLLR